MNTQTNNERNTISVVEDDAFSYDGYQVWKLFQKDDVKDEKEKIGRAHV